MPHSLYFALFLFQLNIVTIIGIDDKRTRFSRDVLGKLGESLKFKKDGYSFSKKYKIQQFNEYEKCKWREQNEATRNSPNRIHGILAVEGHEVILDCNVCIRPDQSQRISWQRLRTEDAAITVIAPKKNYRITPQMQLRIKSVDVTDAGQYYCVEGLQPHKIYQLDVHFTEERNTIHLTNWLDIVVPPEVKFLKKYNLKVYIKVETANTDCNVCGKPGEKFKDGNCMVDKIDQTKPVLPEDIPLLDMYPDGVPCRSSIIKKPYSHLPDIRSTPSLTWGRWCYVSCPTTLPPINVTDVNGKLLRVMYPSYQSIDKPLKLPSMVIRQILYEPLGKHLVLRCPTDEPSLKIRWQRGTYNIKRGVIRPLSKGRVYLDGPNRLHIKKVKVKDSAVYHCWAGTRHVASMKIIAFKPLNKNTEKYITVGGVVLTCLAVTLVCCCQVFKGRKGHK